MMRRIAVVGDELTSGGTILPYSGPIFTIGDSHQVALIGGEAYCEACKATGIIAKSGGPRRLHFMGETAAHGDIVLCKCPVPPSIIAVLADETWCDDMAESDGMVVSSLTMTGAMSSITIGAYDERVKVTEGMSDGYPYYIETADGDIHSGRLDASGMLPCIHTGNTPSDFVVYWGDEALAKQNGV